MAEEIINQEEKNQPQRKEVSPEKLKALQDGGDFTQLMVAQEELKTAPFGEIWDEYCRRCGKPVDGEWYAEVARYEKDVLSARA